MSRFKLITTAVALALACSVSTLASAQDTGIYQPLLSDFHVLSNDTGDSDVLSNQFIQFGKVFTGGFNYTDFDSSNADELFSAGVFFKPQLNSKDTLVIGTSFVKERDGGSDDQIELQVKYTLANSLSFAAGYYDNGLSGSLDNELYFARLGYDVPLGSGKVTVSPLFQRQQDDDESAGLFAVYTDKSLLIGGGTDGEQARGVINFKFPEFGRLKPAAEILRVDGTPGDIDTGTLDGDTGNLNGAKVLLVTGTLDFSGGFLAQGNSVGRASGPSAVYFNNPVSFTSSAWNRGYDVWEFGKLANFRVLSFEVGPSRVIDYSTVVYPMQIIQGTATDSPAKRIFVGYRHVSDDFNRFTSDEPIVGYFGTLFGKFSAALSVTYDFDEDQGDVVLGLTYLH